MAQEYVVISGMDAARRAVRRVFYSADYIKMIVSSDAYVLISVSGIARLGSTAVMRPLRSE